MAEVKERVHTFGRNRNLIGIVTEPVNGPSRDLTLVIPNAGIIHRVGPSRFVVEIARTLARAGYRVLRFDLSGIGDSPWSTETQTLEEIVRLDLRDAVALAVHDGRVGRAVLLGLCSGADNSLVAASTDDRVRGLVLIDPTVYLTPGFHVRRAWRRLLSPRSWWNVISGRSLFLRLRARVGAPPALPPHLDRSVPTQAEQVRMIAALSARQVRFLYVLTSGAHSYCNYPGQIVESLPGAFGPNNLRAEWRPEADHLLSRAPDRHWLAAVLQDWLSDFRAEAGSDLGPADRRIGGSGTEATSALPAGLR
jgi:pimeloyl-ACP methyl ester carboxylesterase